MTSLPAAPAEPANAARPTVNQREALPPGPSTPALIQTLRWMIHPPLALMERHRDRYGDAFRFEVMGPRFRSDRTRWPLVRRTTMVFSAPEHLQEIFALSGNALRAGEAREFMEWFVGRDSLFVLDGEAHLAERREMRPLFGAERMTGFQQVMQAAAARAFDRWPTDRNTDLKALIDQALEEINLALGLGATPEEAPRLLRRVRGARRSFAAPIHFVPVLRANLGPWSPGGRLAAIQREVRQIVRDRLHGVEPPAGRSSVLSVLLEHHPVGPTSDRELDQLISRIFTLLGGLDSTSAALWWTCHHLLQNPPVLARSAEEARAARAGDVPGSDSYLEAVCLEAMRMSPPLPAVLRRVAEPVTVGGFALPVGSYVIASIHLLHHRSDLFPEPEVFKPERFMEHSPHGTCYAPFGGGVRRCPGGGLAMLQMRVLLAEMLRRFDIVPGPARRLTVARRNLTVVPATPLRARLRLRTPAARAASPASHNGASRSSTSREPDSERDRSEGTAGNSRLPGPGWPTLVQTLVSMRKSIDRDLRYVKQFGDIFQLRLLIPRLPHDSARWPLVSGRIVVVTSPELMREVFTQAAPALSGGEGRQFTEWFLGSKSLLVLDGEEHLHERRALFSLFTPERLARSEELMRIGVARTMTRFPSSGRMRLAPQLQDVTLRLTAELMFGPMDERTLRRLRDGALRGLNSMAWSVPALLFPWLRRDLGPLSPGGQAARTLVEFREILAHQVTRIRDGAAPEESWLAELLALEEQPEDPAVIDRRVSRVLTILAGTDIVFGALTWCCYHLLRNPEVLARAYDEVRSTELTPPDRRPYLQAVCEEALRIHPPIPVVTRRVIAPVTLGGYRLEPGAYVVGSILLAHRRPDLFPEPEKFRPERFLERSFSPYEYLPFGGGVRRCLGQAIGFRQMAIVLAALLRTLDLTPLGRLGSGFHRRAIMMLPNDSLRVAFRRRG